MAGYWVATATVEEVKANRKGLDVEQGQTITYATHISGLDEANEQAKTLRGQGLAWRPLLAFVNELDADKAAHPAPNEYVQQYWLCRNETGQVLESWPSEDGIREAIAQRYGF
ncbi:hypothetical protein ACFP81_08820 [Deinococcus lacus]|uniref:Uncharacterized protein n=1 Tax=Deinococcus lacus TaxID=392561 RepID=A0ABW1YCS4_9DEIO